MYHRGIMVVVVLALCAMQGAAAADDVPGYAEHQNLKYYLDANGRRHSVNSPADWERRRGHILAHMQRVMGPLPQPQRAVPLNMRIIEEANIDGMLRRKIAYHTDSNDHTVSAYLFLPQPDSEKRPAVLCLHQTTAIGKGEPAGIGGKPNLHYALHLARRGYVTLAPDYPSFGDYNYDFQQDDYVSGTMKAIYDNIRAVDLLQSLDAVDGDRIGCIGHSLGGHNAMFTAAFEPRIKCIVSNCGFTRFHKYYGGKLQGWTSPRYMPRIAEQFDNDPDRVPFDFTEIVAAFAPRAFLASAPVSDGNFEVTGVKDVIAAAGPIYRLYDAEDRLRANYPNCGHDFPPDAREAAYAFFDRHLKASTPK